jgi:hypothetical protein
VRLKIPGAPGPVARTGGGAYFTRTLIRRTTVIMMIGSHPCCNMGGPPKSGRPKPRPRGQRRDGRPGAAVFLPFAPYPDKRRHDLRRLVAAELVLRKLARFSRKCREVSGTAGKSDLARGFRLGLCEHAEKPACSRAILCRQTRTRADRAVRTCSVSTRTFGRVGPGQNQGWTVSILSD